MASSKYSEYFDDDPKLQEEKGLMSLRRKLDTKSNSSSHIAALYASNAILLSWLLFLFWRTDHARTIDPTLGVYSPANGAVEYIKQQKFRSALLNNTEYMGYPTDEKDQLWADLYNFGISKISEEEASQLPNPTLSIPGTNEYLVQLDIWHELHCLNDLRTLLYPERFQSLEDLKDENGVINREHGAFRHWDHCIDSLRQTLMCHADISPIPFHVNVPSAKVIVPRLGTTHTCRNFTKVQEWSKAHFAGTWNYNVTKEQADEIIATAGFDQSPEEDIEHLYWQFPGNPWFKYWRDHPEEAEEARKKFPMSGGADAV